MAYTTWNPADKNANIALSNGDLTATKTASGWASLRSIYGANSGKWYWEITVGFESGWGKVSIGTSGAGLSTELGVDAFGWSYGGGGWLYHNDSWDAEYAAYTTGDIISIALDMDAGKVWWAKNGVWQGGGDPAAGTGEDYSGLSGTIYAMACVYWDTKLVTANFGDSAFSYSVPSGFTAGLGEAPPEESISEEINILSEFDDNFGELNEDVNVTSEFDDNWPEIDENISINSEFDALGSDGIAEEASVNTDFVGGYLKELSEDVSVNSEFISEHTGVLSEDISVTSEFVDYQQPGNLNVTLPMITADIFGGGGGFLNVTLPMITADIRGGAQLNVILPMITASIAGKTGLVGNIDVILPMITASIAGKVENLGEINVTLPMILAHIAGKTGEVGSINVTLPMITADIQGFNDLTGDLNATLPMIKAYMFGTTARFTSCAVVLRYVEPV